MMAKFHVQRLPKAVRWNTGLDRAFCQAMTSSIQRSFDIHIAKFRLLHVGS